MTVVWLNEAAAELQDAADWYAKIHTDLGARFRQQVAVSVNAIADAPLHFALVKGRFRRAGVQRFPYSLYFFVEEDRSVIVACFHGRRDPGRWQGRNLGSS